MFWRNLPCPDVLRTDGRDQSSMSPDIYAFSMQESTGCKIHRIIGAIDRVFVMAFGVEVQRQDVDEMSEEALL